MVNSEKQVKVVDFGLAAIAGQADGQVGTLYYMAPEVVRGQRASIQSDLYSVGIMAYELFCGKRPFDAASPVAVLYKATRSPLDISPLKIVPELVAIIQKLLAPAIDNRYGSAEEVMQAFAEASGQPLQIETQATRESYLQAATFVGRDHEVSWLRERLAHAMNGNGSAVIIGGESGIGKSRLVDEIATEALVKQALVIRGQGVEGGGLLYQVWREPLRRLVLSSNLDDLEAAIISVAVPDISVLLGRKVPDVPDLPGEASKQRFMLTVRDLLIRQEQPVLLILEDLQWAHESLSLLQTILPAIEGHRLLILGTYRSDERPELSAQLAPADLLIIPRLDHEAVAALSQFMLGEAGRDPEVVKLIEDETEGNAFFMVEVARALAEEARRKSRIKDLALPSGLLTQGIGQIVQRRLDRAPYSAHSFLNLAAVIGRVLNMELMQHLHPDGLESALTDSANAGVLENQDGVWRFTHDKLRDGLLSRLDTDQRRALHRQIAEGLEQTHANEPIYAEMLADHWEAAGEKLKAVAYMTQAAQQLINLVADYIRAERYIQRALGLLDAEHASQRVPLLVLLGDAVARRSAYTEARHYFEASLAEDTPDPLNRIHAYNGLSYIAWRHGDDEMAKAQAEQALLLAQLVGNKQEIAATLNNLGNNVLWFGGDFATARFLLQQSLSVEREIEDKRGMAASLSGLGGAAWLQGGESKTSRRYYTESLAISQEIGDKLGTATSLHGLGLAWMQAENPIARQFFEQSIEIKREIDDKLGAAMSLHGIGSIAWMQADGTVARQFFEQSLAIARQISSKLFIALSLNSLAAAAHLQGDYAQARANYEEALIVNGNPGIPDVRIQSLTGYILLCIDIDGLPDVERALAEGLRLIRQYNYAERTGRFLMSAAAWLHQQGDNATAAAWLGFISTNSGYLIENRAQYAYVLARVEAALEAKDFDEARNKEIALTTDQILDALLLRLQR